MMRSHGAAWRDAFALIRPSFDLTAQVAWPRIPCQPPDNQEYLDVVVTQTGGSNEGFGRVDVIVGVFDVNVYYPSGLADDEQIYALADDVGSAMQAMQNIAPEIFTADIEVNDFGRDERDYEQVRVRQVWTVYT